MKSALQVLLIAAALAASVAHAVPVTFAAKVIEEAVERAATVSGRVFASPAAREAAVKEARRQAELHGEKILPAVSDGGLELLQAMPRYGDDLAELAIKASPQARRVLALDVPALLPLAKTVGVEALEVEAKAPGQAAKFFKVFKGEEALQAARTVSAEDLPRLLKYGEMADNDGTRRLLLQAYKTEGAGLFARIPPKLVLAGGLSAAMLVVADGVSDAIKAWMEAHPVLAAAVLATPLVLAVLLLLWRFGLMPWQKRVRTTQVAGDAVKS